jgi:hypothetical protein
MALVDGGGPAGDERAARRRPPLIPNGTNTASAEQVPQRLSGLRAPTSALCDSGKAPTSGAGTLGRGAAEAPRQT